MCNHPENGRAKVFGYLTYTNQNALFKKRKIFRHLYANIFRNSNDIFFSILNY